MATSFFRKLASRVKSKRKPLQLPAVWARPSLESLDPRILPSVTATLNNGLLSVTADTTGGTTQVEIIQSADKTQITVEDTGAVVGGFDLSQVQQIQFQYADFALNVPVNGSQMTLTGFGITEADLNLGDTSLTAAVNAMLPDGTALSVAGSIDNQGSYDLTGTADLSVDGFSLPATQFELTNTSLAAAATLAVGNDSISLAGSVDSQGNYDLSGTADVTVAGFNLPGVNFELTNTSLTAAATVAIGSDSVSLAGTVDNQGSYDLTGTADVNVAGFTVSGAHFELTNTSLAAAATVVVGGDSVSVAGTVDNQANYDLTGSGTVTVDGFGINASFELTNTQLTASGAVAIGSDSVNLSGTVDDQGNYDLTGAGSVTVAGFSINANFELTNTQLTASASVTLGSDSVNLSGSVDSQGNYDLTGNGSITVAGFGIYANFELTNTQLTASGSVAIGSDSVNLSGTVDNQGNYDLSGNASITVAGFGINASFTLTNTSLTATGTVTLGSDQVTLTGSVNSQGNYDLTGTANVTVAGFGINAGFTLTNTSLMASGTVTIPNIGNLTFSGTVSSQGNYNLTAATQLTSAA